MRVAVTGGSGFIGSHVVDRFARDGHEVVVLDVRPPHRHDVDHRPVDVLDLNGLVDATAGCDAVFHLAAVSNVNHAYADPIGTVQVNVAGTATVWEAARRNDVARAILASTVWVYTGASRDSDLDEEAPFHLPSAGHIYTSSKIAAELVVHNYHDLYGQPFTILRYGIPFGPRIRDELVIANFVRAALAGEPLHISGEGTQARNYVYIDDLVEAHVLSLDEIGENEVINLEGREPISIRRLAESIRSLVGSHVAIEHTPARPGDFAGKEVSPDKALRLLGWKPQVEFDDGLRRYVEWFAADAARAEPTPET